MTFVNEMVDLLISRLFSPGHTIIVSSIVSNNNHTIYSRRMKEKNGINNIRPRLAYSIHTLTNKINPQFDIKICNINIFLFPK